MIINAVCTVQLDREEEALSARLFKQKHNKLQQYNGSAGNLLQNMNDTKKDAPKLQHTIQYVSVRMMETQYALWNADRSARQKDLQSLRK